MTVTGPVHSVSTPTLSLNSVSFSPTYVTVLRVDAFQLPGPHPPTPPDDHRSITQSSSMSFQNPAPRHLSVITNSFEITLVFNGHRPRRSLLPESLSLSRPYINRQLIVLLVLSVLQQIGCRARENWRVEEKSMVLTGCETHNVTSHRHITGTKLGCGEGGCGACTVVYQSRHPVTRAMK